MIIGYARVSTEDQSLDQQIQMIQQAAAKRNEQVEIYYEKDSGGKAKRAELQHALKALQEGNTFMVYQLDRLARSTKQLYEIKALLDDKGVHFVSLQENIDSTTPMGKAMYGMIAVFAEFELNMIQERTRAGLAAARRSGRIGGRPNISIVKKKQIVNLYQSGERAVDIAKEFQVGRSTVYKLVREMRNK